MSGITRAQLKAALTKADEQRANRLKGVRRTDAERAQLKRSRLASEKQANEFLVKAGLDLDKFRTAQGQHSALQERVVQNRKDAALRSAAKNKSRRQASLQNQRKTWAALNAKSDINIFPNPTFTLDTPFLIWSTPFFLLSDSAAVPFGSWAKFDFKTSQSSGEQRVSFYFLWESPFTDFAVIDATTAFSAIGHLQAYAPWTLFPNTSSVFANAEFNVWIGFPNGTDPAAATTSFFLNAIGAYGDFLGSDTEGRAVSSGLNLSNIRVAIPPRANVFFEVALVLDYEVDDDGGNIEADFSGDFEISCPLVVYSILNKPSKPAKAAVTQRPVKR